MGRTHRIGLVIFAVALAVRLFHLAEFADSPIFKIPIVDAATYDRTASEFSATRQLTSGHFWQPFLYPYLLSLLYALIAPSPLLARIVQAGIGALTALLTYRLGARLMGEKAGQWAAAIVALWGPLLFYELDLVGDGVAAIWSVALPLLFLRACEKRDAARPLSFAACAALAVLTRPTFLPPALLGCFALAGGPAHAGRTSRIAALLLGLAVPLAPVAFANARTTGIFSFLPNSGGLNLYIGNSPDPCSTINVRPGLGWQLLVAQPVREGVRDFSQMNRWFYRQAWETVRKSPGHAVAGFARKLWQFFGSRELPRNEDPYLFRDDSAVLRTLMWKVGSFGFPFGLLLPFAILGVRPLWRGDGRVVVALVALYALATCAVFVSARYRVTIIPALVLLGVAGARAAVESSRSRRPVARYGTPAVILLLLLAGAWPNSFCEERVNYRSELHHFLGMARYQRGDTAGAVAEMRRALDADPSNSECWNSLGTVAAKEGRPTEAATYYARTMQLAPGHSDAAYNLGLIALNEGRFEDAIPLIQTALNDRPWHAVAHNHLGIALAAVGRPADAEREFRTAMDWDPRAPDVHFNLALLLLDSGASRRAEVINLLRQEIGIEPDDAAAHILLSEQLAAAGDAAGALEHARLASSLQPDWPEARAALEKATAPAP